MIPKPTESVEREVRLHDRLASTPPPCQVGQGIGLLEEVLSRLAVVRVDRDRCGS